MKRAPALTLIALVACVIFAGSAAAEFERSDWKFFKEIRAGQSVESEHAFFRVDPETYDGNPCGLQSLRIVDADTREIPYQIVTKQKSEKREEFFPKFLNNSYKSGEYNSFTLDFGDERPPVNEITIATDDENFMRRASVEGSEDQAEWNLLAEDAYIYNFSGRVRSKHLRIEFPLSNFRFLRVKVLDDGGGPLKIGGAKARRARIEAAETESWPLKIIDRAENAEESTTEITLDAGYRGLPIRLLQLDVAGRNYHRNVRVESSEDGEEWTPLGSGVIFDYYLPSFKKADNSVPFRENARGRYFRVTVENFDDRPIEIAGVSGVSLVRRVVVSLAGKGPYRAYFGNPRAKSPRYDLSHRMRYIDTESLPRLALGPRMTNPDYIEKSVLPWSEEHAGLLWAVIAAVIAFLALLILNLARNTSPEKDQD